jgi:hypothetical protein
MISRFVLWTVSDWRCAKHIDGRRKSIRITQSARILIRKSPAFMSRSQAE